jgi:L-asparaginase/Glu-tRNA(Gln) amidotransferase subunit D
MKLHVLHDETCFVVENKYFELIESSNIRCEYLYKEKAAIKLTKALYKRARLKENCLHNKITLFIS